jgi:hypothetical protein
MNATKYTNIIDVSRMVASPKENTCEMSFEGKRCVIADPLVLMIPANTNASEEEGLRIPMK